MLRSHLWPHTTHVPSYTRYFITTPVLLSGHNKWSKIKQRKGLEDAKKSVIYGKASRDIVAAARNGGSASPEENSLLATAIRRAKDAGVPKENIETALAKAVRSKGQGHQSLTYEAMLHGSIGIIIECQTDNINRTLSNVRDILTDHGARQAPVKFMFQRRGFIKVAAVEDQQSSLLDAVLGPDGVTDFDTWNNESGSPDGLLLVCRPEALAKVTAEIDRFPSCEVLVNEIAYAPLEQGETADDVKARVSDLVEALEEDDDVIRIWTTLEENPGNLMADC
ncbi:transcriptional regulator TACO1-like protein [Hygrophoropsis aurantiaca]|uniref:Transcriptional regulator TACO1-like protein n=1 Tax=Hygrophoropsis aurantiaca TaxID=72124 RepID=A0ACB8AR04_9AGAM|nr:transcriptional regulator TACO1-like protein [Hygrophoropsis aurantiaca]